MSTAYLRNIRAGERTENRPAQWPVCINAQWLRILTALLFTVHYSLLLAYDGVNVWYDKPLALGPGDVLAIDTVRPWVSEAEVEANLRGDDWSLCWRTADGELWRAHLTTIGRRESDVYNAQSTIEITAGERTVASHNVSRYIDAGGYNSIGLVYSGGEGAELRVGSLDQPAATVNMACGEVYVESGAKAQCRQIVSLCEYVPAPRMCEFEDMQSLVTHLAVTGDICEGMWRYFDRDIDTSKSTLGGMYTLATVQAGDGYDIVHISGGERIGWEPMRIKGHMMPTIFTGLYDTEWVTADGRVLSSDVTVQISADNAILTLRIPILGATLQFSRVSVQQP